jgi:hypothetical protein
MNFASEIRFFGTVRGKGWPRDRHSRQHELTEFEIELRPHNGDKGLAGSNALLKRRWSGEYVDEVNLFQFDDLSAFEFAVVAASDFLMITPQSWPEMDVIAKLPQTIPNFAADCETSGVYLLAECRGIGKLRDHLRVGGDWVEFELKQRPQLEKNVTRPSSVSVMIRTADEVLFDIPVFDTDALSAFNAGVRLLCAMVTINPNDF